MATRTRFNGSSVKVPWKNTIDTPEGFGDQYSRLLGALFDAASFPLTNIGGTEDDVTADLEYVLDGGTLVDGMMFSLTWADTNTGPMTLAINGGAPVSVLDASGSAMVAEGVRSGLRSVVEYIGGSFRILSDRSTSQPPDPYFTKITASTTWNKPAGYADDAVVLIEAWGGGGGGAKNTSSTNAGGGGGGGGYSARRMRYANVPSSLSVTIGAGGAASGGSPGGTGGNTTVGALLTAYGGVGGTIGAVSPAYGNGGRGGGEHSSGDPGGGPSGQPARTIWGGGGGGNDSSDGAGGAATFGGGGGGAGVYPSSEPLGPGGVSLFGGAGGTGGRFNNINGTPGSAPGGGGGGACLASAAAGARGEVRIWIWN